MKTTKELEGEVLAVLMTAFKRNVDDEIERMKRRVAALRATQSKASANL